jgi:peptide/nickel transport system substrate-binding protein
MSRTARTKRSFAPPAAVAAVVATLALSACGSGSSSSSGSAAAATGRPVKGGVGHIIENTEPRSLDPAVLGNSFANAPIIGNGLYGELLIDDPATGKIVYRIAKSLTSTDAGATFTLKLRPDVKFSDGSPFTAAAVKFAWDHDKDPNTAAVDYAQASMIKESTVVDDTTLKITLTEPVPRFANAVLQTGLNWVAKPESLQNKTIDTKPIGAGPYLLQQWARQDKIVLVRNPNYYGAPAPYLDSLEIRAISDQDQRYNTLQSGAADLAMEGVSSNVAKAGSAGLQTRTLNFGGGIGLVLNTRRPPFNDVRARQAVSDALNLDTINTAAFNGDSTVPTTLFDKSSPFYQDIPLQKNDPAQAQKLFDTLAAEGKPVSFSVSLFPGSGALGNSIQTQLSTFKNVTVKITTIDLAQYGTIVGKRQYDVLTSSVAFGDPEPRLWFGFNSASTADNSGIDDPQLNAALDQGRKATTQAEQVAAYKVVQERLAALTPMIFYTRATLGVMAAKDVGGVTQYGFGSVLPEDLWIRK